MSQYTVTGAPEIKVETITWILDSSVTKQIESRYRDGWEMIGFHYIGLAEASGLYHGGHREYLVIWRGASPPNQLQNTV